MPRDVNGDYSLPSGSLVSAGLDILYTQHNTPLEDIADAFNEETPLKYGGTGASTASGARSNLGLGSIATQAADNVAITGGTLDQVVIGGTTPEDGTFDDLVAANNNIVATTGAGVSIGYAGTEIAYTASGKFMVNEDLRIDANGSGYSELTLEAATGEYARIKFTNSGANEGDAWIGIPGWDTDMLYVYAPDGAGSYSDILAMTGSSLDVSGNTYITGTLGASGAVDFGSTLDVTGATVLGSTLDVTGNTTVGGTFGASGAATFGSTLGVTGAATLSSTLAVTGAATFNGTLRKGSYDVYHENNILGTVSQSGGVPTGAVIETGSDANGYYTKYADGTLICWSQKVTLSYSNASSCAATWTFPEAFTDVNYSITATLRPNTDGADPTYVANQATPSTAEIVGVHTGAKATTSAGLITFRGSGMTDFVTGDEMYAHVTVVGRWF